MSNITELMNKYYKRDGKNMTGYTKIHKAEKISNEYHKRQRLKATEKNRYLILQSLLHEIPFHLNKAQVSQIEYWLVKFNSNFKNFHRKSSEETIILAFIMIQRKRLFPNLNIEKYSICKKYNLTSAVFELIQNRLIFELMRTTPLTYNQSKHYNHEILTKEGR